MGNSTLLCRRHLPTAVHFSLLTVLLFGDFSLLANSMQPVAKVNTQNAETPPGTAISSVSADHSDHSTNVTPHEGAAGVSKWAQGTSYLSRLLEFGGGTAFRGDAAETASDLDSLMLESYSNTLSRGAPLDPGYQDFREKKIQKLYEKYNLDPEVWIMDCLSEDWSSLDLTYAAGHTLLEIFSDEQELELVMGRIEQELPLRLPTARQSDAVERCTREKEDRAQETLMVWQLFKTPPSQWNKNDIEFLGKIEMGLNSNGLALADLDRQGLRYP